MKNKKESSQKINNLTQTLINNISSNLNTEIKTISTAYHNYNSFLFPNHKGFLCLIITLPQDRENGNYLNQIKEITKLIINTPIVDIIFKNGCYIIYFPLNLNNI